MDYEIARIKCVGCSLVLIVGETGENTLFCVSDGPSGHSEEIKKFGNDSLKAIIESAKIASKKYWA